MDWIGWILVIGISFVLVLCTAAPLILSGKISKKERAQRRYNTLLERGVNHNRASECALCIEDCETVDEACVIASGGV